jgi:paraquat-inducible protein B
MQQKKTYIAVGLFVVVGLACLAGIILKYAGNQFSADKNDYVVMYFEESVQGLNVGSQVLFQGVQVAKVADISLVADFKTGTFKTPVLVLFDSQEDVEDKIDRAEMTNKRMLDSLIEKGLRARLVSGNLLTGQLMIELIMDGKEPPVFRGTGQYIEIPTELSPFAMISQDLQEVPLRETLSRLGNIIQNLEENLPQILENMTQITQKIDKALDKKSGEASKSMQGFNAAMEEVSKASRSIKNLTDYLERHPEALLMGKEK